ncbi:MAG: glutathione S-transferase family protein [Ectothiorhodospiraceae bacterium]|nr:glutathione S-transferase family protein [Ectothiorhodospiraceae bacterium]
MNTVSLSISSKNYSSWSMRGWLLVRFSGLPFEEELVPLDAEARKELLLQSSSFRVPCLRHGEVKAWDTLAIAEYLHEIRPEAGLLPEHPAGRAYCRSICGEMHSGFASLRTSLPFNVRAHFPGHRVFGRAMDDIDRITTIWRECLERYGGPFLFGGRTMADAMYAPVVLRFATYDVQPDATCQAYCDHIRALPEVREWVDAAMRETEEIDELDMEF